MARNQNPEEKNLQNPVEETTEISGNPVNQSENVTPAENADENNNSDVDEAKAEEEAKAKAEEEAKWGKVEVKEPEYKYFDTIKVPAKIKKIIDFYGITSKDLFDGSFEKMKLKKEEVKALKEWYATLI